MATSDLINLSALLDDPAQCWLESPDTAGLGAPPNSTGQHVPWGFQALERLLRESVETSASYCGDCCPEITFTTCP